STMIQTFSNGSATPGARDGGPSDEVEQCHEPVIHVRLHMAMKQRTSFQLGREIHLPGLIAADHRHVLAHARRRMTGDAGDLERVTMEMGRMNAAGRIAHAKPIAPPMLPRPHYRHGLHVEWHAIDLPEIEAGPGVGRD